MIAASENEFEIRPVGPADAEQMLAYLKRIGGESDNLTFGPEGIPFTVEKERAFLQARAEDPRSVMLGVWHGGELIADGSVTALSRRMSHRGELGIAVAKKYWNRGVGSMLMEQLIRFAKEAGLEWLDLDVRSDNAAAIHLYEKFGFRRVGTRPAYFKIGNEYFDFDIMTLDLKNS